MGDRRDNGQIGVSGGDDKAAEYKRLVARASMVLMCKTDLKPYVRFSSQLFHADVRRLNPAAPVIELSAASGEGMKEWTQPGNSGVHSIADV